MITSVPNRLINLRRGEASCFRLGLLGGLCSDGSIEFLKGVNRQTDRHTDRQTLVKALGKLQKIQDKCFNLIELDNVGMIEQLEYLNLAINFAQIVVVQSCLIDNLNCNLRAHTSTHTHAHTHKASIIFYSVRTLHDLPYTSLTACALNFARLLRRRVKVTAATYASTIPQITHIAYILQTSKRVITQCLYTSCK